MYILTSLFFDGVTTFYCLIFDSPSAGGLLLHYILRSSCATDATMCIDNNLPLFFYHQLTPTDLLGPPQQTFSPVSTDVKLRSSLSMAVVVPKKC